MSKEKIVADILKQTGGNIEYQEQVIQIGLEVLGLTIEEADHMRKTFAKMKMDDMKLYQSKLVEVLGEEKGTELYYKLFDSVHHAKSKTMIEAKKHIYRQALKAAVESTDGKVVYSYQLYLVLKEVAGLSEYDIENLIEKKTNGEKVDLKQYISGYCRLQPLYFEDVIDEIVATIPEDFTTIVQMPVALVAFQK